VRASRNGIVAYNGRRCHDLDGRQGVLLDRPTIHTCCIQTLHQDAHFSLCKQTCRDVTHGDVSTVQGEGRSCWLAKGVIVGAY